jgi:hypothetical protein
MIAFNKVNKASNRIDFYKLFFIASYFFQTIGFNLLKGIALGNTEYSAFDNSDTTMHLARRPSNRPMDGHF